MKKIITNNPSFFTGLALFSMFFGAGNIIFPLIVGQVTGQGVLFALLGLLLTAVVVPLSGFFAITLFKGDYESFFLRLGKIPAHFLITLMLLLLGPFGALPRCIVLTHSTLSIYAPSLPFSLFTILFALLIYICTLHPRKILSLLGVVLTPILLLALLIMFGKGLFLGRGISGGEGLLPVASFHYGLKSGYNTMDLLASFFFASVIYQQVGERQKREKAFFVKACGIGGILLALVYSGFALTAAMFSQELSQSEPDKLLGMVGYLLLGREAGFFVSVIVFLSCLTTAIALSSVSSAYFAKKLPGKGVTYQRMLAFVLILSVLVSLLKFSGIAQVVSPILQWCYPLLILFSFLTLLRHRLIASVSKL